MSLGVRPSAFARHLRILSGTRQAMGSAKAFPLKPGKPLPSLEVPAAQLIRES